MIILLTNEEDCSTPIAEVFNDDSTSLRVNLPAEFDGLSTVTYRCFAFADQLFDTSRYARWIEDAKGDAADVVFVAISGFPIGLSNPSEILASSDMAYVPIANGDTVVPRPACISNDGLEDADPARRIAQTAQALEANGATPVLGSICEEGFSDVLTRAAAAAGARIRAL